MVAVERHIRGVDLDAFEFAGEWVVDWRDTPGIEPSAVAVSVVPRTGLRILRQAESASAHHPVCGLLFGEKDEEVDLLPLRWIQEARRLSRVRRRGVHVETMGKHHRVRGIGN